jgi:hypothetical protein
MAIALAGTYTNGARVEQHRDPTMGDIRRGEQLLVQWCQGLFLDALNARNRIIATSEWRSWEKGYWGDTWPDALPSYKSPIQINEIKRLLLTELSDLTDNAPTIYVSSDPQTGKRDQQVERALQAYWQRTFLDLTILEACADAAIWPCGFFEIVWNPLKAEGQGDIVVRARAPQTVFPDPYATDDEDWRYVITQDVMDINVVRQMWPDQGHRVMPDAARPSDPQPIMMPAERPSGVGLLTPLYPITAPVPTHGMDTRVTVYGARVKDTTLEVVPSLVRDPEGVEHLQRAVRYKYPQGRLIHATNHVILYDGPQPYLDGFDLIRLLLQPAVHHFWPNKSLLGELLEIQIASDKAESLTLENMLRIQKAGYVADAGAGIDPRTFMDIPGQVHLVRPGARVEPLRPPPLPADLVQAGARWRTYMREQLGHSASRQGQSGRGNVSAELTETEISQAMGLTRLRARFLHKAVHQLASKLVSRMGQFYTTPRALPYMQGEEWAPVQWQPLGDPKKYAAYVDPASFSVQSKTMIKRLALMLAKMGRLASDEDLLKILEFPGGKEIAERNKQQLALMAQARGTQRSQGRKR